MPGSGNKDRRSSFESVLSVAIDTALKDVHTILPGQVISFDPVSQTANIQPELQRNIDGELVNLPVLSAVPVRFMKSGDFSITFPLKEGDEIAIYVIERSIDNWFEDGGIQSPNDTRKFDLSDAFVVPILYSQSQKVEDFDADNLVIKSSDGSMKITLRLSDNNIVIETPKAIIDGDLDVTGKITAPTIEAATSLKVSSKEVDSHDHGGSVTPF